MLGKKHYKSRQGNEALLWFQTIIKYWADSINNHKLIFSQLRIFRKFAKNLSPLPSFTRSSRTILYYLQLFYFHNENPTGAQKLR